MWDKRTRLRYQLGPLRTWMKRHLKRSHGEEEYRKGCRVIAKRTVHTHSGVDGSGEIVRRLTRQPTSMGSSVGHYATALPLILFRLTHQPTSMYSSLGDYATALTVLLLDPLPPDPFTHEYGQFLCDYATALPVLLLAMTPRYRWLFIHARRGPRWYRRRVLLSHTRSAFSASV